MTAFSTSNRWSIRLWLFFWILTLVPAAALAASKRKPVASKPVKTQYRLNASLRSASTLYGSREMISNRGRLEGEYKAEFSRNLQAVIGGRLTFETDYSQNSMDHADTVLASPFYELALRDTYVTLKKEGFSFKTGYQTLVWGEAFGNFYTDILNPKDFRELWLNDLAEHEISIPMLNAQYAGDSFSFQLVCIPKPSFNRNPNPDSPYAPDWSGLPLREIRTETVPSWFQVNEWAARLNTQIGSADLSLFGFSGLDRNPHYATIAATPQAVVLGERHSRIQAQGLTASADLDGSILRFESVLVNERRMNLSTPSGLGIRATDNLISVLGYDFPRSPSGSLGLQLTTDLLFSRSENYLFREDLRNTFGVRWWREFRGENQFELIANVLAPSPGALIQPRFTHPLSRSLELRWGADLFFGKEGSEYDRFQGASRAWIRLTGYFNG